MSIKQNCLLSIVAAGSMLLASAALAAPVPAALSTPTAQMLPLGNCVPGANNSYVCSFSGLITQHNADFHCTYTNGEASDSIFMQDKNMHIMGFSGGIAHLKSANDINNYYFSGYKTAHQTAGQVTIYPVNSSQQPASGHLVCAIGKGSREVQYNGQQ